jgi:hypothetical protein
MTEDIPEGLQAQANRVVFAQENYARLAKNLVNTIDRLGGDLTIGELPTNVSKLMCHYEAALIHANKQEAEYAKQFEAINGVIEGGAHDAADARAEILGRITSLRERGGG